MFNLNIFRKGAVMETAAAVVATGILTLLIREGIPAIGTLFGVSREQKRKDRQDTLNDYKDLIDRQARQIESLEKALGRCSELSGSDARMVAAMLRHILNLEFTLINEGVKFLPWKDKEEQRQATTSAAASATSAGHSATSADQSAKSAGQSATSADESAASADQAKKERKAGDV